MNIAAREPIATRELRQAARLKRGPFLLGGVSVLATGVALLMTAAMTSPWSTPTEIGPMVFEGMFGLATFVAVLVGATVAASGVASEREGHTWEALLLSGLRPAAIARGKFLSAFAQAALYLFALAPSAALSFLVGGVTVTEIIVAFALLLGVTALAVVFGLAVSSYAKTARGALAGSMIATLVVGPTMYGIFTGLGVLTGQVLGQHEGRGATWLAHAIAALPFEPRSTVFFVLNPIIALVVPGWLVYEVTKANLSDASDDRSSGLRRWYVFATVLLVGGALATLLAVPDGRDALTVGLLIVIALHLGGSALVFSGEPLGPSRRVLARWGELTFARKLFGPGLASATLLHAGLGTAALVAVFGVGRGLYSGYHAAFVSMVAGYIIAFHLFVAGLTGVLAARMRKPNVVRGLLVAITLMLFVTPLIAGAVGRAMSETPSADDWKFVESLSPLFTMLSSNYPDSSTLFYARVSAVGYGIVGIMLVFCTWLVARRPAPATR